MEESRIVKETRQKIATGKLTYEQMKEKLIVAINKEYEQEGEPNIELINACEELLAELATDGKSLPESLQETHEEVIRQNIQNIHHMKNKGGFGKRLVVSLLFLIILLNAGTLMHQEWFEHGTTDGEQQHVIQGFVVDPGLVAKAIANENEEMRFLSTNQYDEVKNFLGFNLPNSLFLTDWDISLFYVAIKPLYIKCSIQYTNSEQHHLTIHLSLFTTIENAFATIEQDNEGEKIIIKGREIYRFKNQERNSMMWIEGNCVYYCNGDLSDLQLLEIIQRLVGRDSND